MEELHFLLVLTAALHAAWADFTDESRPVVILGVSYDNHHGNHRNVVSAAPPLRSWVCAWGLPLSLSHQRVQMSLFALSFLAFLSPALPSAS